VPQDEAEADGQGLQVDRLQFRAGGRQAVIVHSSSGFGTFCRALGSRPGAVGRVSVGGTSRSAVVLADCIAPHHPNVGRLQDRVIDRPSRRISQLLPENLSSTIGAALEDVLDCESDLRRAKSAEHQVVQDVDTHHHEDEDAPPEEQELEDHGVCSQELALLPGPVGSHHWRDQRKKEEGREEDVQHP